MKIEINQNDMAEFVGQIIDTFEDFLTEKGVQVPHNPDDEDDYLESGNEEYVNIYGCDYGDLQTSIEAILENWSK